MTYLVDHAVKNVWCTPDQDKQSIVKLRRLTAKEGVWQRTTILWRRYPLPNKTSRFHLFSIGQLFPTILGLFPFTNEWRTLAESSNLQNMLIDVYTASGITLSNSYVWYRYTEDRALIIAVEQKKMINIDYGRQDLFMQVYSNAYFQSSRADNANDFIHTEAAVFATQNDILAFQLKVSNYANKPGKVLTFLNGLYCSEVSLITAKVGDLAEFVYDSSIEQTVTLKVKDLDVFVSTLDQSRKYLINFEKTANEPDTIRFTDDIYVYLVKRDASNRSKGLFFHRNSDMSLRMVTHRDYSVSVDNLVALARENAEWSDPEELELVIFFRKSGYLRNLVFETNRIHELYKLPNAEVKRALLGIDSTVSVWRAEHLEQSAYLKTISALSIENVTPQLVEDAYGYNAEAFLVGFTPVKAEVTNGQMTSKLPPAATSESVVYEYDSEGLLTSFTNVSERETYACASQHTKYVEAIVGAGKDGFDEYYGESLTLNPIYSYRFYTKVEGDANWKDVTGTNKYVVINGVATWNVDRSITKTVIRSDRYSIVRALELNPVDGLYDFVLQQVQNKTGTDLTYKMEIPPGFLDVFLNGRLLIEGLDYFVVFPKVVLTNKKYLINPSTQAQKLVIRCRGFCNSDLSRRTPEDVGFVQYGMLSRNSVFNLRDDRVMRVNVDGCLYTKDELKYVEGSTGMTVGNSVNGMPYSVREITVPLKAFSPSDTYQLQDKAHAVNEEISEYLTLKLPEPTRTDIFTVAHRYYTYSPFANKIMHDMLLGVLNDPRIKEYCPDSVVREICEPYKYLLAFDPCTDGNRPDENFVYVHPHHLDYVVDVDAYIYKFMSSVVRIFLKDRVQLSSFLRIVF